ncbi:hypothetical protein M427DRAFT_327386 [Gonapodya prolifera JEL478]|uniref:Uncharacterized protein n=1 Tax=Gonapodya prolifera (strain JEL478) TaxID=1344416 RepID=A0A139AEW3_GONPJ|nr:hypothetical protein M427DRAFT_327386 [Gonapodya prolifera JEL478]|eukprot:KXS15298.1 hypothetical protein M427DRAFT_327386 [Gonapodya prolifera JEL478]
MEILRVKHPIQLKLARPGTFHGGRWIAATLDVVFDENSTENDEDQFAAIAAIVKSLGNVAFAGFSKLQLPRIAPPHVLASWLTNPVRRPLTVAVRWDIGSVFRSPDKRYSFPRIEAMIYDCPMSSLGSPHLVEDVDLELFPSYTNITINWINAFVDTGITIQRVVSSLVGTNSKSLRELVVDAASH